MRRVASFLYIVWVCRISTFFSLLALVFIFVPQARDLLLDYRTIDRVWYWTLFFGAFLLWFLALFFSARLAVGSTTWATSWSGRDWVSPADYDELRSRYLWAARRVPYLIPLMGAAIMSAAFLLARSEIPLTDDAEVADELIAHLNTSAFLSALYGVALTIMLSAITFFRWPKFLPYLKIKAEDGTLVAPPADPSELRYVTFVFGALAIVLVVILVSALVLLIAFPSVASEVNRAALAFLLLSIWIPIISFIVWFGQRTGWPVTLLVLIVFAVGTTYLIGDNHAVRSIPANNPSPHDRPDLDGWIDAWARSVGCDLEPRNTAGDPVRIECDVRPIVIAASGGASRAAYFTASVLGKLMDRACGNAPCPKHQQNPFVRQVFALSSVSGSTLGAVAWVTALERAEVLARRHKYGHPCRSPSVPERDGMRAEAEIFLQRFEKLATAEKVPDTAEQPAFDHWHLWRAGRKTADGKQVALPHTWQDCMEATVAGDYLSPAVAQLVTRDVLPWPIWSDRNVALEDAFDNHMGQILKPHPDGDGAKADHHTGPMSDEFLALWRCQIRHLTPETRNAAKTGDAGDAGDDCGGSGMSVAAKGPQPISGALGEPKAPMWRPLVISNGASAMFGNRILASPIRFDDDDDTFLDATDAHTLLNMRDPDRAAPCGLPIKTAISHSARFPIVSTEGDFVDAERDENCDVPDLGLGRNYDQTIDGGYFESIGVTSVYDVVVRLVDRGLNPFILVITNDPTVDPSKPQVREVQAEGLFGAFGTPVSGVIAARSARGIMSVEALERLAKYFPTDSETNTGAVDPQSKRMEISGERREANAAQKSELSASPDISDRAEAENFAFVRVVPARRRGSTCADLDEISMSWWLSFPVQAVLRDNVTAAHNADELAKVCRAISTEGGSKACNADTSTSISSTCKK